MATVIGVRFKNAGKLFYFDPGKLWPVPGSYVLVETARGVEYGQVITGVREIDDESIGSPLKQVIRIGNEKDAQHAVDNERFESEAFEVCRRKIDEHKLDMKLVGVEQTFDNAKVIFYFTANGRVDFRSLVKDLASVFRTRIELRQIGVRDEAKMLGGLGPCGRPICCGSFLGDFQPVSIKMAKEQSLSLNPTKISGVCGRLMCCLKFEEDHYEETRHRMPRVGKEVETPDGFGTVIDMNVLKETLTVRMRKGESSELKTYALEDVKWFKMPPSQPAKPSESAPVVKPASRAAKREEAPVAMVPPVEDAVEISAEELDVAEESAAYEPLTDELDEPSTDWKRAVEEALRHSDS